MSLRLLRILLALGFVAPIGACGSSSSGDGGGGLVTFATVAPATAGTFTQAAPPNLEKVSGFLFKNEGTSAVSINQIEVDYDGNQVAKSAGSVFISVEPGDDGITFLFDTSKTHDVQTLSFVVNGSTEKLVVSGATGIGPVPSGSASASASSTATAVSPTPTPTPAQPPPQAGGAAL